jgi:hypothetical protein
VTGPPSPKNAHRSLPFSLAAGSVLGGPRTKVEGTRLKRKNLKSKGRIGNLALGEEVEISQVTHMENQTLVGCVSGRTFAVKTILD